MRFNYGQRDESLPKFPIPGGNPNNFSPAPSTSATGSPTAAPSASSGQNKLTICHSSGDSSDPYVRIVIDANQSNDHFNSDSSVKIGHENDLLLNGDVSCPTTFQSPIPSPTP